MKLLEKIKLNIGQKLLTGFGIIFIFILLNAALTVIIHVRTSNLQDKEMTEYLPVKEKLTEMGTLITETKRLTVNWVYVDHQPDSPEKEKLRKIIDSDFDVVLKEVKENTLEWDKAIVDTLAFLDTKVHEFFDLQRIVMNNLNTFESYDDVMAMMESEMLVQSDGDIVLAEVELNQVMTYLISECDKLCDEIESNISFWSSLQLFFCIIMALIVMVMSGFVGFMLYQSIVNPLKQGVLFAQAIGRGDLTATVDVNQDDEIGQLSDALRDMVKNLRNIVMSIEKNANDLVDSGDDVKSNSLKLSKGASEQAASAEEVSTAIEEMVANIDQNTENAIATEKITTSTAENVTLSSQYSAEAAEAMSLISQKITIISDIAFQTNILALNAAVEAVRAGEHGRGFSVVAAEVRKLAERSKQAANEIVDLVAKGMKVSQMAGEKAKMLVPEIEKTTVLVKEISAASIEQKTGAEQINLAMQNLNVITQENASSSDELTNSSVQLSALAENLRAAVSFFKIDESQTDEQQAPVQPATAPTQPKETVKKETTQPSEPKPRKKKSEDHMYGTKIDLGNLSSNEFDLDNYEKF
jgi:methyl-accepting chemotaxis protein